MPQTQIWQQLSFRRKRRDRIFFTSCRIVDSQSNGETTSSRAVAQPQVHVWRLSNAPLARFLLETGQTCEVTGRGQR
jgi:hypothetical protein